MGSDNRGSQAHRIRHPRAPPHGRLRPRTLHRHARSSRRCVWDECARPLSRGAAGRREQPDHHLARSRRRQAARRGAPARRRRPSDVKSHGGNLVGACLAGVALAQAGIAVHHRTCHVLGGGWKLPHAETHAVLLPHSTALVAQRALDAMARHRESWGAMIRPVLSSHLLDRLRLPTSLSALGMPEDGLDEAARRVMEGSRDDPLVPGEHAVRQMLDDAFFGRTPPRYRVVKCRAGTIKAGRQPKSATELRDAVCQSGKRPPSTDDDQIQVGQESESQPQSAAGSCLLRGRHPHRRDPDRDGGVFCRRPRHYEPSIHALSPASKCSQRGARRHAR